MYLGDRLYQIAWSPCHRFIAVAAPGALEIRDAVTLNILRTFESPSSSGVWGLSFSPDGRILTQVNDKELVTWDLQTGVSVSTNLPDKLVMDSAFQSLDGERLTVLSAGSTRKGKIITTHDISTSDTHSYQVQEGLVLILTWTHGEFLRFATVEPGSITTWEVDFAFSHTPKVVESLPAPDEINLASPTVVEPSSIPPELFEPAKYLFLPTLSRLAIAFQDTLSIWDARDSKFILKISPFSPSWKSFSSDGRFFASMDRYGHLHVWKESSAGYILHQVVAFAPRARYSLPPLLSPNGESLVISIDSTIYLLHTKDQILQSGLTWVKKEFALAFSPDGASVAFARRGEYRALILDLQSGDPRLTIDTDATVGFIAVAGGTVAVVQPWAFEFSTSKKLAGGEINKVDGIEMKGLVIFNWKLVVGNGRANIDNCILTTTIDSPLRGRRFPRFDLLMSPDLSRIVTFGLGSLRGYLEIYDASTGRLLANVETQGGDKSQLIFTPDGCEIWIGSCWDSSAEGWEIVEDSELGVTKLQPLGTAQCPPVALPWRSSRGYEVTDDWWVLSPTRKRLLWLPHRWRSEKEYRKWSGRFLGLGHVELPKPVILEFLE